ncbi:tetratricopeptide repeat protein [Dactylosporangium aurantiacum]|uniref:Tetratricopeptide repeat protein n=1 Tax=Dactylosporangium aurantiacum TaxID=35754 RepID=A0A9Q9IS63_9ACTN|nr:BTAD domain-containing putative transcriptional regulator [Dactylosporangium aurantiacum]MDG6104002.1 tetratricopeptide repeat protein [Dactylosporangium aurantiacum]UWZ58822.1 tetratricopeptide repeat protein [Dactylosporangium aurantiacum]
MFHLLGTVTLDTAGAEVELGPAKQRIVLAALLADAGLTVTVPDLVDRVWGDEPPAEARNSLYTYVSRLRRLLRRTSVPGDEPASLIRHSGGYELRIDPDRVDVHRFRRLVTGASGDAGSDAQRAGALWEALQLWRGTPLADLPGEWAARTRQRWCGERVAATLAWADVELRRDRPAAVIGPLTALAVEHPLDESLTAALMRALHAGGRGAEALDRYARTRRRLIDELGVEPGRELQVVHLSILHGSAGNAPASPSDGACTAAAAPAQLPPAVAAFTGQAAGLAALDTVLSEAAGPAGHGVVTITGTAGVGKTALAVHWAHQRADRFPDGQLYVNLRGYAAGPPVPPIDALAALLRALGVGAERVPVELGEATALYRSMLAGRRVLVVLDNARAPEQVRPLLPGAPGCLALITSRDRLGGLVALDGAHRVTVDVLAAAEAALLLERLLGEQRVRAEREAAAELAAACAYLPLALRIAAANLAGRPHRSIAGQVTELRAGNRLAALTIDGDEEAAVRVAFDLSYRSVSPAARRMFRLLGLVPGADVPVAAAAALTGADPAATAPLLDQLAAAHLIDECAADRYTFHDLLRRYAREHAETGDDGHGESVAALQRLLSWYLHTLDRATRLLHGHMTLLPLPPGAPPGLEFAGTAEALAWLDGERHNLVAAVRHAAERGPHETAWLLADRLRPHCVVGGHLVDLVAVAGAGLAAAEAAADLGGQSSMRHGLGCADYLLGRHDSAVGHLRQALALAAHAGWRDGEAAFTGNLGLVQHEVGQLADALRQHRRALELYRLGGHLGSAANVMINLGNVYHDMGRLVDAAVILTESVTLNRQAGLDGGAAAAMDSLGTVEHSLGHFDRALDLSARALAIHRRVGSRYHEARLLSRTARVHADLGDLERAFDLAEAGVELSRDIGERRAEASAATALAAVHEAQGRLDAAARWYRDALAAADEIDIPYLSAAALAGLASAYGRLEQYETGLDHARRALDITARCGFRLLEGQVLSTVARLHLDAGRPDQAVEHARRALDNHRGTGHRLGEAGTLAILAEACRDGGLYRRAALDLFAELGVPAPKQLRVASVPR